jgi:hypothetical protein
MTGPANHDHDPVHESGRQTPIIENVWNALEDKWWSPRFRICSVSCDWKKHWICAIFDAILGVKLRRRGPHGWGIASIDQIEEIYYLTWEIFGEAESWGWQNFSKENAPVPPRHRILDEIQEKSKKLTAHTLVLSVEWLLRMEDKTRGVIDAYVRSLNLKDF